MKLLLDQNISFRIVALLEPHFPNSQQVRLLKLENNSDLEIWEFAKQNAYTIVTFDSDFSDICNLKGFPPKIVWLRTGNTSTKNIAELLVSRKEVIEDFLGSSEGGCLELHG